MCVAFMCMRKGRPSCAAQASGIYVHEKGQPFQPDNQERDCSCSSSFRSATLMGLGEGRL